MKIFGYLFIIFFVFSPPAVFAETNGVSISPQIIEEQTKARDILEYKIKIKNIGKPYKAVFYPIIKDIDSSGADAGSPVKDRTNSIQPWINMPRGAVGIMPGEEAEIPLRIDVYLGAKPGKYHGKIIFSEGANLPEAESKSQTTVQPEIILNIEVKENIVLKAEIKKFDAERGIFIKSPAKILLQVKNIGNREITPRGFIYIYNRRNQEAGKIDINEDNSKITPDGIGNYESNWSAPKAFGQYKAKLELEYGDSEKRDLQDTIYFWVLPWPVLAIFGGGILAFFTIITIMFKKGHSQNDLLTEDAGMKEHEVVDLRRG